MGMNSGFHGVNNGEIKTALHKQILFFFALMQSKPFGLLLLPISHSESFPPHRQAKPSRLAT